MAANWTLCFNDRPINIKKQCFLFKRLPILRKEIIESFVTPLVMLQQIKTDILIFNIKFVPYIAYPFHDVRVELVIPQKARFKLIGTVCGFIITKLTGAAGIRISVSELWL